MGAPSPVRAWFAFAVVIGAWGSSYLFIKRAIDTFTPLGLSGSRFVLAGLACAAIAWRRGEAPPLRRDLLRLAITGTLMMSGANALTAFAQASVPSGVAAVFHSLSSLWLVLLGILPAFGRVPVRLPTWFAVACGIGGIALLLWPSGDSWVDPIGGGALVLATWMFTVASMVERMAPPSGGAFGRLAVQMFAAAAVSLALASLAGGVTHAPITARSAVAFAWLVFVSSLAGFGAYGVVLRAWPPARVGSFAVLSPVLAVLLGVLFEGEPLTARMAAGAAVTLGSVAVVQVAARR